MHIQRTSKRVRNFFLTFAFVGLAATTAAVPDISTRSYLSTPRESRIAVLEYCRINVERNEAKSRHAYRATFEKALAGDFRALDALFTDERYHTNDIEWDLIPWHILHVIGDRKYSAFVLSHPPPERAGFLALQYPFVVGAKEHAAFERYFRQKSPRTYSLWAH